MLIDCHTHVGGLSEPRIQAYEHKLDYWRTQPPDRMITWMNKHNIDQAVILPIESPEGGGPYRTTFEVLEVAAAYPNRFIPFCVLDPRMRVYGRDKRSFFESVIKQYIDEGARGFGEIKCGVPIEDDRMEILYEVCSEYDLPMLLHLDDQSMMDGVGLPGLERMLEEYPDADFILHSHAWWSHISADVAESDLERGAMPDGPVVRGGRCEEILSQHDNAYADISAGSGWNELTRDTAYTEELIAQHHKQILFGSDRLAGFDPPTTEFFDRFEMSSAARQDISHRNLERILR